MKKTILLLGVLVCVALSVTGVQQQDNDVDYNNYSKSGFNDLLGLSSEDIPLESKYVDRYSTRDMLMLQHSRRSTTISATTPSLPPKPVFITIDAQTEELLGYIDLSKPLGKKTSIDDNLALDIAKDFLMKYNSQSIELITNQNPEIKKQNDLRTITWYHHIKGVEAENDKIEIRVRDDGEVVTFTKRWIIPDNITVTAKIGKEEAISLFENYLNSKDIFYREINVKQNYTSKMIVSFRNDSGAYKPTLLWEIEDFSITEVEGDIISFPQSSVIYSMLINGETGEILSMDKKEIHLNPEDFGIESSDKIKDILGGAVSYSLDRSTGEVVKYFTYSNFHGIESEGNKKSETKEDALSIAKQFVETYSSFPKKNIELETVSWNEHDKFWIIRWRHYIDGIEAEGDIIQVRVRDDGNIIGFVKRWNIPDDITFDAQISEKDAFEVAKRYLKSRKIVSGNGDLELCNLTKLKINSSGYTWYIWVDWIVKKSITGKINAIPPESRRYIITIDAKNSKILGMDTTIGDLDRYTWDIKYIYIGLSMILMLMLSVIYKRRCKR